MSKERFQGEQNFEGGREASREAMRFPHVGVETKWMNR